MRGVSALLWLDELGRRRTASLAFFGATALPLVVAIVTVGTERGGIAPDAGASLVGAGMVSVLAYPLLAGAIAGEGEREPEAPLVPDAAAEV